MNNRITVKAKIKLIPTNLGGRMSGIKSGYRPNHVFQYKSDGNFKQAYMGTILFDNIDIIEFNMEHEVIVKFLLPKYAIKHVIVGNEWWIHEGGRLVGNGTFIEIIN